MGAEAALRKTYLMQSLRCRFVTPFSAFVCLLSLVAAAVALHAQTGASYGIAETKNVMVAMRDGVKLAADIYRPTRNGQVIDSKFPVILMRTPYNKDDAEQIANAFVPHGYVVVLQDVRGRYKSEGTGFLSSTIRTMALIPRNGLGHRHGAMVGSGPWDRPMRAPRNMHSPSPTLPM